MSDAPRYRTLAETPEFSAQFLSISERYPSKVFDPIIDVLLWGIASNPREYDQTTWNIRIAKNRTMGLGIPQIQVMFQIQSEGQADESVLLLWIEELTDMNSLFP
jgi:hypothetical protein